MYKEVCGKWKNTCSGRSYIGNQEEKIWDTSSDTGMFFLYGSINHTTEYG
jgi:hypothetical protein